MKSMKESAVISLSIGALFLAVPAFGQGLAERVASAPRSDSSKAEMLRTLLHQDISVAFNDTQAQDAINFIAAATGVNIIGRYNDDRTQRGIDPEMTINLEVQNRPALAVLEMILEQAQDGFEETTWQLRDGFVEVGTKDRLNASREMRIYPVRDLLFVPPMFSNAPSLDLDAALDGGGSGGGAGGFGGPGGGGFGPGGGGIGGPGGGGLGGPGGGGRGGDGPPFTDPGDPPARVLPEDAAEELIDIIVQAVEPAQWDLLGGTGASIRYHQNNLIVLAPDYIHRQIAGYPFIAAPARLPE